MIPNILPVSEEDTNQIDKWQMTNDKLQMTNDKDDDEINSKANRGCKWSKRNKHKTENHDTWPNLNKKDKEQHSSKNIL